MLEQDDIVEHLPPRCGTFIIIHALGEPLGLYRALSLDPKGELFVNISEQEVRKLANLVDTTTILTALYRFHDLLDTILPGNGWKAELFRNALVDVQTAFTEDN
jgi:hypothetical protein